MPPSPEYPSKQPPPLPPPPTPPEAVEDSSGARIAATLSVWAAVLVLVLITASYVFVSSTGERVSKGKSPIWYVGGALVVTGFILAIIALKKRERDANGIFGRAFVGLTLNGGIIFVALVLVPAFNRAKEQRQAREARARVESSVKEMNAGLRKDLARTNSNEFPSERFEKVQKTMKDAEQDLKGEEALLMEASSAHLQKLKEVSAEYFKAAKLIQNPPVMNMSGMEKKEDLEGKRILVRNFLKANKNFKDFVASQEVSMKQELEKLNVSHRMVESYMQGFHSKAPARAIMVKIRETDERIGNACLGMIDVLDENWEKWSYSTEKQKVIFRDNDSLAKYNAFFQEMTTASREQLALQKKVTAATTE